MVQKEHCMRGQRLFFVLYTTFFFISSLYATTTFSILNRGEAIFSTVTDNTIHRSISVNELIVTKKQTELPQISLYKYHPSSHFIIQTKEKKIPLIKATRFIPNETIYIVCTFHERTHNKPVILHISTAQDSILLKCLPTATPDRFIGILQTTTQQKKANSEKNTLYVKAIDHISVTQPKSRSATQKVLAGIEIGYTLETLEKDLHNTPIWLIPSKTEYRTTIGVFHKGTVIINNQSNTPLSETTLHLNVPKEVRLQKKRFLLDGKPVKAKRTQNGYMIVLPALNSGQKRELDYIFTITATDKKSLFIQTAVYYQKNIISNFVKTKILIDSQEGIAPRHGYIVGRIKGIPKTLKSPVTLFLSNGYSVQSDHEGKFHFEGVRKGLHVLAIDPLTVPDGYTVSLCRQNARSSGSSYSTFVDVKAGTLSHIDFCLHKKKTAQSKREESQFRPKVRKTASMPNISSADTLKYKKKEHRWLWPPKEGFVPSIGSVKAAILFPKEEKLELYLNDEPVDALNREGVLKSSKSVNAIALFRGIDIKDGDNYLKALFRDKNGKQTAVINRTVHFSGAPYSARLLPKESFLTADGKHTPVIALQLFDRFGYPLRESMTGTFYIDAPYRVYHEDPAQNLQNNQKEKYHVTGDGVIYITLQPTTVADAVNIHIPVQQGELLKQIKLQPQMRNWIVTGFGEVGIGSHTDQKKHMAFFAKGTVKGSTLLTLAYDSGKPKDLELFDRIDPAKYYTIYEDNSLQNNETPSQKKFYVKIERENLFLQYGDIQTGLHTSELAQYDRSLNGFKTVLHHNKGAVTLFASNTQTLFQKEEIRPDGTVGKYHLKKRHIIENSEKVYLVIRDRYRKERILSRTLLTPLLDYTFYYDEGALYFKTPVFAIAEDGNPRFIEVSYETEGKEKTKLLYGGRATFTDKKQKSITGLTYIHEEEQSLAGIDEALKLNNNLSVKAEYASSKKRTQKRANAWYLETTYRDKKKEISAYIRKVDKMFGMKEQTLLLQNSLRYGIDATVHYHKNFALDLKAYRNKELTGQQTSTVFEFKNRYIRKRYETYLGYKSYQNFDSAGSQLLGGITAHFLNYRLKTELQEEYSLQNNDSEFPTKTVFNIGYALTPKTDLFFRNEWISYRNKKTNIANMGITIQPWERGVLKATLSSSFDNDQKSLYSNYLYNQGYQVTKNLTLNGGIEKNAPISGNLSDDEAYTSYNLALSYQKKNWRYSVRTSYKDANESKITVDLGVYTEKKHLNLGLAFGIRGEQRLKHPAHEYTVSSNLALAYRPQNGILIFDKLNYIQSKNIQKRVMRYLNTMMLSQKITPKTEMSLQGAVKYTKTYLDTGSYSSLITRLGADVLYDINTKQDIGLNLSVLNDWKQKLYQYTSSIYTGYNILPNTWLTAGYHFTLFETQQNRQEDFRQQGPYLNLRMKFDQNSLQEIAQSKFNIFDLNVH